VSWLAGELTVDQRKFELAERGVRVGALDATRLAIKTFSTAGRVSSASIGSGHLVWSFQWNEELSVIWGMTLALRQRVWRFHGIP
jgi:hypothetical protein